MANNVDDKLLSLLEDNWTSTNTSRKTPAFIKITDVASKIYDFNKNKAVIIIQRPLYLQEKNSIGKTSKRLNHLVRVDLRVLGKDQEDLFIEMYNEIIRICDSKISYPFGVSSYDELDIDSQPNNDLSDRSKGMFRVIIPVRLIDYNKTRGI